MMIIELSTHHKRVQMESYNWPVLSAAIWRIVCRTTVSNNLELKPRQLKYKYHNEQRILMTEGLDKSKGKKFITPKLYKKICM